MSSYHWKDGWMFARVLSDGSGDVEIWQRSTKGDPRIELHIPAAEWASIVASVSARGENAETYQAAVTFHNASQPTPSGEALEALERLRVAVDCHSSEERAAIDALAGRVRRAFSDLPAFTDAMRRVSQLEQAADRLWRHMNRWNNVGTVRRLKPNEEWAEDWRDAAATYHRLRWPQFGSPPSPPTPTGEADRQ